MLLVLQNYLGYDIIECNAENTSIFSDWQLGIFRSKSSQFDSDSTVLIIEDNW